MSRGAFYTESEDKRLLAVFNDNPGEKLSAIAERAQKYGICTERDTRALAQHIGRITSPETEEPVDDVDPKAAFWEAVAHHFEDMYLGITKAVLWEARLYKGQHHNSLTLDYKKILKWYWENDPESINAAIEAMETIENMEGVNA